jgi:hypothetical protein
LHFYPGYPRPVVRGQWLCMISAHSLRCIKSEEHWMRKSESTIMDRQHPWDVFKRRQCLYQRLQMLEFCSGRREISRFQIHEYT